MSHQGERYSQKTPDVASVSGEDGSADVMNEGFHKGKDSVHGLDEPSTSMKIYQKKDVSDLNKHEHCIPAINQLAESYEERFTQSTG